MTPLTIKWQSVKLENKVKWNVITVGIQGTGSVNCLGLNVGQVLSNMQPGHSGPQNPPVKSLGIWSTAYSGQQLLTIKLHKTAID